MTKRKSPLTFRQEEVLRLVAQGKTSRQIGLELGLSPQTVKNHLSNIYKRLGIPGRTQKKIRALVKSGILDTEPRVSVEDTPIHEIGESE